MKQFEKVLQILLEEHLFLTQSSDTVSNKHEFILIEKV